MSAAPLYILLVEDEPEIARFMTATLKSQGYGVGHCDSGRQAVKSASARVPDLIILDLGLPDIDGKEVIASIRGWSRLPIIILSARDQESEKVAALEAGADDYLTKPFGTAELLARIKVALRHASRRDKPDDAIYSFKDLKIDFVKREISVRGMPLHLTPTEYSLIALLGTRAGQVVTQAEILREVWGRNAVENDHYLRIYVQRLRQKIGDSPLDPVYIFTEPGIGYRLSGES